MTARKTYYCAPCGHTHEAGWCSCGCEWTFPFLPNGTKRKTGERGNIQPFDPNKVSVARVKLNAHQESCFFNLEDSAARCPTCVRLQQIYQNAQDEAYV